MRLVRNLNRAPIRSQRLTTSTSRAGRTGCHLDLRHRVGTYVAVVDGGMRVVLTKKLADRIDDVDLTGHTKGDVLDLPPAEARLLIAEEWAMPDRRASDRPRRESEDRTRTS